jgi:transcription initiation factor TFIIB
MSDPGEQAAQAERKSVSGAPASRNLKKATWEMNRVCNGLWLSCQVAERSAYFYRKALQKSLIKGRSISGFVVAFIYLACKERMITSDDRRGKQGCRRGQAVCDALLQDSCWRDAHRAPIADPFRNITKISGRDGIEERVSRREREREILSSVAAIGRLWARACLCWRRLLPCTLRPWSMGSTSPRQ